MSTGYLCSRSLPGIMISCSFHSKIVKSVPERHDIIWKWFERELFLPILLNYSLMEVDKQRGMLGDYFIFAIGTVLPLTHVLVWCHQLLLCLLWGCCWTSCSLYFFMSTRKGLLSGLSIKNNCAFPEYLMYLFHKHDLYANNLAF